MQLKITDKSDVLVYGVYADYLEEIGEYARAEAYRFLYANRLFPWRLHDEDRYVWAIEYFAEEPDGDKHEDRSVLGEYFFNVTKAAIKDIYFTVEEAVESFVNAFCKLTNDQKLRFELDLNITYEKHYEKLRLHSESSDS